MKMMVNSFKNGTSMYAHGCVYLPQPEFFEDNEYGITLPVNNRDLPDSMNKVFERHGYYDMLISTPGILHVGNCNEVWSGDFDAETRGLFQDEKVLAAQFKAVPYHHIYLKGCILKPNMVKNGIAGPKADHETVAKLTV